MSQPMPAPSADERAPRGFRAPKSAVRVTCRRGVLDMGRDLAASLLGLSETGVRLVVKEPLEPGREVSVGLAGPAHRIPVMRLGKVAWSMPSAGETHHAEVAFHERLPYRDFLELSREPSVHG
jgi:hypothetical protein